LKRLLVLAILALPALAAPIGTCVPGALSNYIGNPCSLGDKIFDNFSYSGNVDATNVNVDFQMVGTEFRLILAPVTGAGFFTTLSFTDRITVQAGVAPNILPAIYQIVGVKDQSNFSFAQGTAGQLQVVNGPGPAFTLMPGNETGAAFFAPANSLTTVSP